MELSKAFFAVGIAVVFIAFVAYAVNTLYEPPKYYDEPKNDCAIRYDCYKPINECQNEAYKKMNVSSSVPYPVPLSEDCYLNYSNTPEFKICQKNLELCNQEQYKNSPSYAHARNTFIILLAIGILAIVAGTFIPLESVSAGIIGGGVLTSLYAVMSSMSFLYNLSKFLRLAALGIVLVVLLYLGYKRVDAKKR